jgi:hypothetical protein
MPPDGAADHAPQDRRKRNGPEASEGRKEAGRQAAKPATAEPVFLSGGNPEIAKGDGDAPAQVYIAAMPGGKSDVGRNNLKKAITTMKKSGSKEGKGGDSPSRLIDARIKELSDWRGETLARVRMLIKQADPEVVEEWKWRGVPVWSHAGIICTGETYKNAVKMTFAKGASLEDPSSLFNSSLEGNTRRAIDLHEGDEIDEDAFKTLIRAAAALNRSSAR